jgi:hypothetical protein
VQDQKATCVPAVPWGPSIEGDGALRFSIAALGLPFAPVIGSKQIGHNARTARALCKSAQAKLGIILGSLVAGIVGMALYE